MAVDRDRIARILVEAATSGNVGKTAEKWGITDRTLRNYRERLLKDPQLSEMFRVRVEDAELAWKCDLVRSIRTAFRRAEVVLEQETDLNKITNFIKESGGVAVAREALGVDGSRADQPREAAAEDAGGDDAEEPGSEAGGDRGSEG